jgi:hypothetical protein
VAIPWTIVIARIRLFTENKIRGLAVTIDQQTHFENEILHAALAAERDVSACRLRISVVADRLETLVHALREHPEEVTRLPEPHSVYDYREELTVFADGEKVVNLCNDLRFLIKKAKGAEKRKGMLISGPFFSREASSQ